MEFSATAPQLHSERKQIRRTLLVSEQTRFEEIQNQASAPPKLQKRRITRQIKELNAFGGEFQKGIHTYQSSLDNRVTFIQNLEDNDRRRMTNLQIKKGKDTYEAADQYVFEYRKATHLTQPREMIEHKNLDLEKQLYLKAQSIITESAEFNDYKKMHVGKSTVPPKSAWQLESEKGSKAYIAATQKKEDAHQAVVQARDTIAQLSDDAEAAETKVRDLNISLEKTGGSMSFEARLAARKKMLKFKDEADFLREQSNLAKKKAEVVKKNMMDVVYADTVTPLDFEELEGIVVPNIDAWVLAMPLKEGGLGTVYYGSFNAGDSPPQSGWTKVHEEAEENPEISLRGPPAQALKQRMLQLKTRQKMLEEGKTISSSQDNEKSKSKTVLSWMIQGCGMDICNGRFIEAGNVDGVFKFQNEEGVSLMRTKLKESPDLGITAATCNTAGIAGLDNDLGRKLTRIVALPDAEIEREDLDQDVNNWGKVSE